MRSNVYESERSREGMPFFFNNMTNLESLDTTGRGEESGDHGKRHKRMSDLGFNFLSVTSSSTLFR